MADSRDAASQLPLEPVPEDGRVASLGALLFTAAEPIPLGVLAGQLGCSQSVVREALTEVDAHLHRLGLMVQWCDAERIQLATAPALAPLVQRFLGLERTVRLSQAALETLAIVAYRQPVTRPEVEAIRGVDSTAVVQNLVARGFIEAVGRAASVGNPVQYATTPEFLRFFGLRGFHELPPPPDGLRPNGSSSR
ncbi:MAG TPA: SMC-Scp complex subunit ScpB [Thermomicrobiaceae bacterium]|nr:SMC-Scp complex subunit ScpB [Thermomicrobiaceae bacterium]